MHYLQEVKKWLGEIMEISLMLLALGIVVQILFGEGVLFFGGIIPNLTKLITALGENGLVGLPFPLIKTGLTTSKSAIDGYAIDKLESGMAVAGRLPGAFIGPIDTFRHPDLATCPCFYQGILKIVVRIGPACAIIAPAGISVNIDRCITSITLQFYQPYIRKCVSNNDISAIRGLLYILAKIKA